MFKQILSWIVGIVAAILFVLILDYLGLLWFSIIGPQKENVRREVFESTRSFNESKMQDLVKYRYEYLKSNKEDREVLASTIRHMYADYDENKLPPELKDFLHEIKYGVTTK